MLRASSSQKQLRSCSPTQNPLLQCHRSYPHLLPPHQNLHILLVSFFFIIHLTFLTLVNSIVSSTEDDFLASLTSKISLKLREEVIEQELNQKLSDNNIKDKLLKSLDEYFETELSSFNCQICFEIMKPPENLPYLLFPCGHTFCEMCLNSHLKDKTRPELRTCPYCR